MSHVRSITAADFADDCPVSLDLLGRILRAGADGLAGLLDTVPEGRRAQLAVWLYGHSHTRAIGVRVAATCDGAVLRQEAGALGAVLHDLSQQDHVTPVHDVPRSHASRRISLGGSRAAVRRALA